MVTDRTTHLFGSPNQDVSPLASSTGPVLGCLNTSLPHSPPSCVRHRLLPSVTDGVRDDGGVPRARGDICRSVLYHLAQRSTHHHVSL